MIERDVQEDGRRDGPAALNGKARRGGAIAAPMMTAVSKRRPRKGARGAARPAATEGIAPRISRIKKIFQRQVAKSQRRKAAKHFGFLLSQFLLFSLRLRAFAPLRLTFQKLFICVHLPIMRVYAIFFLPSAGKGRESQERHFCKTNPK
jgi:hypothetical protein